MVSLMWLIVIIVVITTLVNKLLIVKYNTSEYLAMARP